MATPTPNTTNAYSSVNANSTALITAVSATTTQTSADQSNTDWRGAMIMCNVSSIGVGSISVVVQGKDPVSGVYFPLLTGASLVASGMTTYNVYPGSTVAANNSNGCLPATWRVVVTAVNAFATSYTISACLLA